MWSPFPTKGSTNERPKLLLYELYNQLIATSGEKMEEKKRLGLDFTEHNRKYKQEESGFDLQMTKVRVQPSTFLSQRFSCKLFNCIKLCSVQCFFHYLVEITWKLEARRKHNWETRNPFYGSTISVPWQILHRPTNEAPAPPCRCLVLSELH